ncbi:hypothetical protein YTPLAS18_39230 [Nitrospira sp.]|nr:hypothetical protein YTPLAS18_39230 [Nitrospira sp.]
MTAHKKLALIAALLTVLVGISTYFFAALLEELNSRLEFSTKELLGTEYIQAAFPLERDLLFYHHELLTNPYPLPYPIEFTLSDLDAHVRALDETDQRLGVALETSPSWHTIRLKWESYRAKVEGMTRDAILEAHTGLLTDLIALISHVGDQSNLILDPALDSYYLMDTLVNRLQVMVLQLGQIRAHTLNWDSSHSPTSAEQAQFVRYATSVRQAKEGIQHNFQIVFDHTTGPALRPMLMTGVEKADTAFAEVLTQIETIANDPHWSSRQVEGIRAATSRAIHASSDLYDIILPVMNETVTHRVDEVVRKKLVVQLVAGVTLLIVLALFFSFLRNQRERQQAQLNLFAQEEQLHAIVHGALDAVVTMDRHGVVTAWNPQAETIFGYPANEAVGRPLVDLIVPIAYRTAHREGLTRYLSSGEEHILGRRIEVPALRKNGEEFPAELTVIALRVHGHIFFSSFIRDITDRKQAEAAVREGQNRLRALIDHAASTILVLDVDGVVLDMNGEAETLYGMTSAQLIGKRYVDLCIPGEAREAVEADLQKVLGGAVTKGFETPVLATDGTHRIVSWNVNRFMHVDGTPGGVIAIGQDVTKRKRAEEAAIAAAFAAEQASRAKSEFLAVMSHEMRTPLNAILGITDFLTRTPMSDDQLDLLRRSAKAGEGLLRLIEDLLLAAKAESGTLRLTAEPFLLVEAVVESLDLLAHDAATKGLRLDHHLDPALPTLVVGDDYRLREILLNLVRNAIKFTATGSVTVCARSLSRKDDIDEILFTVADTGVGIPQEDQNRIFEKFTQIDASDARRQGGVGLGLSICRQLIEMMGGRIWIEDNPGGGSIFSFTIQLHRAEPVQVQHSGEQLLATQSTSPVHGLRVLLAEDFMESQDIMRLYLRDTPHRLDCAGTGHDVVALFKQNRYDLVFMDLQMPVMDGYAATRQIRQWEEEQGRTPTPIIALSANALGKARTESLAAGCNEFLTKPIVQEAVLKVLSRYAERTANPESPPALAQARSTTTVQTTPDTLTSLKAKFIKNRHQDITLLQTAVAAQNWDTIQTLGHRMKGLAGSYGLKDIGAIGGLLEMAAQAHDPERAGRLITDLGDAVRRAQAADAPDAQRPAA